MVETGESRTPLSTTSLNITQAALYHTSPSQILSNDPTKLIHELLYRLIAIGDIARQLNHALGRNGHRPDEIQKLLQEISNDFSSHYQ